MNAPLPIALQQKLLAAHQRSHEGLPARGLVPVRVHKTASGQVTRGVLEEARYRMETLRGTEHFKHRFAKGSEPLILGDLDGNTTLAGGNFRLTERGFVDGQARGNTVGETTVWRTNPSGGDAPSKTVERKSFLKDAALGGSVAVAYEVAGAVALSQSSMTPVAQGLLRGGVAVAAGLATGLAAPRSVRPVAVGLVLVGLFDLAQGVLQDWRVQQAFRDGFGPREVQTVVPAPTPPAAALPRPGGYAITTSEGCLVHRVRP